MMNSWATIDIDFNALAHNFARVKKVAPHSNSLAMVKTNAYGHGLIQCAKALNGADALGVARINEGVALREAGITQPIVSMSGALNEADQKRACEYEVSCTVHSDYQLDLLKKIGVPPMVWFKLDTGMGRLGFSPDNFKAQLNALEKLTHNIILMSHLSDADDPALQKNHIQLECFMKAFGELPYPKSLANSAAVLRLPETHFDWVRPGLMLYGASPLLNHSTADLDLKPVMSLRARVITVKTLAKGETTGYGSTYVCDAPTRVAVLGIGYGDGLPRVLDHHASVLLKGKLCPIIGRVSMDMITLNVSGVDVAVGDEALLWGAAHPVEALAASAKTLAYELFVHIAPRQ